MLRQKDIIVNCSELEESKKIGTKIEKRVDKEFGKEKERTSIQ